MRFCYTLCYYKIISSERHLTKNNQSEIMNFAYSQWIINPSIESMNFLKDQGVKAIETGPSFLINYDEKSIGEIAERIRMAGIELYSTHAPFVGDNDLSKLNTEKRTKIIAVFIELLNRAAIAGIKCVVIHPGGILNNDEENRLDKLRMSIETLLPVAEKSGVKMALENMPPGHVGDLSSTIMKIVNDFDSPFFGACFDTGHANIGKENSLIAFENMREKIIAFHFHDNDGARDIHLQPPYGTINWTALAKKITKYNYDFPALIEAQPWNNASPGQLLKEVEAIFTGKLLTIEHGGRKVKLICEKCGHYCFGTPEDIFCGCNSKNQ